MFKSLLLAIVICILAVYASCDDTPTLLVHKSVEGTEAIVNTNVTFTITIYNIGQSAAYDVEVKDNEWPEANFELVSGDIKANFESIAAGSNVALTYTVVPKIVGGITTEAAIVTYKIAPEEETKHYVRSTVLQQIPILTQAQYNKKHDSNVSDWVIFAILSFIPVGIPALVYLYANNQITQLAGEKKKKQQ